MQKKIFQIVVASVFVVAAFTSFAHAQYGSDKKEDKTEAMPGMDEEMMKKMEEYGTPNENHKALNPLAGDWDYTMTMWMDPASPPQTSTGTASSKWISGGRFLEETVKGEWMGKPFEGRSTMGYDNHQKEYFSIWLDNMMTGYMLATGSYDPATKTLTLKGDFDCPIRGKMTVRSVIKINDENTHTYESYSTGADGKEIKTMEILYKRKS